MICPVQGWTDDFLDAGFCFGFGRNRMVVRPGRMNGLLAQPYI